jgi:hypothetical protein
MTLKRETLTEIRSLEERLANPASGAAALAPLFAAEFREFGSSGRVFDAPTVLSALDAVTRRPNRGVITLDGFRAERVATNVILATYLARSPAGPGWKSPTLRSSLWCKREGRWQIVFHQGTPVAADGNARADAPGS